MKKYQIILCGDYDTVNETDDLGEAIRLAREISEKTGYSALIELHGRIIGNEECLYESDGGDRNARIIDSGWDSYAREEGHYCQGEV